MSEVQAVGPVALESTLMPSGSRAKPNTLFLHMVFLYVALLTFAYAFESGLFKLMSAGFAFWVFAVMVVNAAFLGESRERRQQVPIGIGLLAGFLIYYMGMGANLLLIRGDSDLQEWLKITMAPPFLIFGFVFAARDRTPVWDSALNRLLFWMLVILPFLVWIWQLALGRTVFGGGQLVGFFVNRNNAALYYLCLVALYGALTGRQVGNILIYLFVGVAFGTLGVLLAVVTALLLAVGKLRYVGRLLLVLGLGVGLVFLLPEQMVLARINPVLDSYRLLAEGRIDLRTVTYGELVTQLRTTDLSFIFRLKHWTDLWEIFRHGSLYQTLFGFGVGASVRLSDMHLVPHNDYVRYLFECGLVSLIGFLMILFNGLRELGRRWITVPLLGVVVYFFSENLINNYLAMIVFFFSMGASLYRVRAAKATALSQASA